MDAPVVRFLAGVACDLDALTLARLCDGAAGAVVVDLRDASLRAPGRPLVSLLRRRMLAPLLLALARAPAAGHHNIGFRCAR